MSPLTGRRGAQDLPDPAPALDLSAEGGVREAWRDHSAEMLGFALRSLGDRGAAEDAVQATFVRAWRSSSSYDGTRPLRSWLFAILRNVVIDEMRARQRRAVPSEEAGTESSAAAATEIGAMDRLMDEWVVHEALLRIRPDQRTILVETYYRGRRYADVARELGIPEGTARTRAFYGLQALRVALDEIGWSR